MLITPTIFKPYEDKIQLVCTPCEGGVSEGLYSSLNMAYHTGDSKEKVDQNRSLLANKLQLSVDQIITPNQTHTAKVGLVEENCTKFKNTDALISNLKNECIGVLTADCVPVILYDPVNNAAAAIHAGWKGLEKQIVSKAIDKMAKTFHSKPKDLLAYIGPSISQKNYEVGAEVIEKFEAIYPRKFFLKDFDKKTRKGKIDLWKIATLELISNQVIQDNIEVEGICTYDDQNYFSARRLGLQSGRFITGFLLKNV